MTREQFYERFAHLSDTDEPGITALAKQIMDDARESVRAAVEIWAGANPEMEQKAAAVLSALDELAFVPMTERGDPADPRHRAWFLRITGNSHMGLRAKVIALINRMLEDRRRPPARPVAGPPMEENPPIPRVCDEAYLVHRQLLNFAESREQYYINARAFLALPDDQKDEEIQNLKKTNTWKMLTAG